MRKLAPVSPAIFSAVFMIALGVARPSAALESSGVTVPVRNVGGTCLGEDGASGDVQQCLDESEGGAGVDALSDGDVTPETFDPGCSLIFHLLARGAAFHNAFGWYNVKPDANSPGNTLKPSVAELHTFLLPEDTAPLDRPLSLEGNPAYAGGLIGFFIATGYPSATTNGPPSNYENLFFSERAHNPDSALADPSVHLIIWQSVSHANSFYFGWEDALSSNDNDFQDIFTRVDGIQCSGGGEACDTGAPGACKAGTMQCQHGELACVANAPPSAELCNALDDDCNGEVDDGAGLCPGDDVCDRGQCVPRCSTGEFRCNSGYECTAAGTCVDPTCAAVTCPEGQVCLDGACVDGCQSVTCPYGDVCRLGRCVDPCASITCDEGYTCHLGVCVDCDCSGCPSGKSCVEDVCVDTACASVSCTPGTHCSAGACVDDCSGSSCPGGAACAFGECAAANGTSSNGGSGGGVVVVASGGAGAGGTPSAVSRRAELGSKEPGCACGMAPSRHGAGAWLGAVLALLFGRRRVKRALAPEAQRARRLVK